MNIEKTSTEYDTQNNAIRKWYSVDGILYAIVIDNSTKNKQLVDNEGYPIDPCNDHNNIIGLLTNFEEKHYE